MTSPFRRTHHTAEEIAEHKTLRLAEAVARKLEGLPEPRAPQLVDCTDAGIAANRILEIDLTTDVGWGDLQAIRIGKHHVRNAVSTVESFSDKWRFNTLRGGPGGWNVLAAPVTRMIDGQRARINPTLHVAKAEFDAREYLRRKYDEIEATHLEQVAAIKQRCDQLREGASKGARSKIRQREIKELQGVLDSLASATRQFEADFNDACREVGFS